MRQQRPNIFAYQDYRKFLADWFLFSKSNQTAFSMRALAKQAGLASGYLPMMLAGKRALSLAAWQKLAPALGLTPSERSFFENLLNFDLSKSHAVQIAAVDRMKRSLRYQKQHPRESEVFEYLTNWHYVAIREMASLPDFEADPHWIQARLISPVSLQEVATGLEFLLKHGYLEKNEAGKIQPPQKSIECSGEIYRLALGEYHREFLGLAEKSIENTPSSEREIIGHTVALSPKSMAQARTIAQEAIQKIRDLGENETEGDSVYHIEVALFPLTQKTRNPK